MSKNYVKQFRLDNGIKLNGEIKLLNHEYSNHIWLIGNKTVHSIGDEGNILKVLTYSDDSEVMVGLLNGTIEFEVLKEYKRVVLASAVNRLSDSEDIFIKINDQYNIINFIEVMKGQVEVGYNDIQGRSFGVSHMGNEKNNLEFYKEVV
jgi:hypothetical protein